MATKKEIGGMKGETCICSHHNIFGWVVLIIGVLFLLRDLNVWNFFNIQWWTVLFILIGIGAMCKCCHRGKCC